MPPSTAAVRPLPSHHSCSHITDTLHWFTVELDLILTSQSWHSTASVIYRHTPTSRYPENCLLNSNLENKVRGQSVSEVFLQCVSTTGLLCSSPIKINACKDSFQCPVTLSRNNHVNKMRTFEFFISVRHHRTFSCRCLIKKNSPSWHYSCSIPQQTRPCYAKRCYDKSACWQSLRSTISLHLVFRSEDEQTKTCVRLKARNSNFSWQIWAAHINSVTTSCALCCWFANSVITFPCVEVLNGVEVAVHSAHGISCSLVTLLVYQRMDWQHRVGWPKNALSLNWYEEMLSRRGDLIETF